MVNPQEKEWFSSLTDKRKNTVSVLKEEGLIDVFVSHIVDTYRESAHFIYELLQNADDVNATKARFELRENGVLFAHNGTTGFSISDPAIERRTSERPGHINAITTFSLSSKKEEIENKIGKFGIGFKSVFQYSNTPHIYNPPYFLLIKEFMIPEELPSNVEFFKEGETTVFWLPFDKESKPKKEAYNEIYDKIITFNNPLLFLKNLKDVELIAEGQHYSFSKKVEPETTISLPDTQVFRTFLNDDQIIRFDQTVEITDKEDKIYNLPISVGFVLDKNGNVTKLEKYQHYFQTAWCFFPTYQETRLNYIINAPFILTPNREALKEGRTENSQLISSLAMLMENAIQGLKGLGLITEQFYTTIPIPDKLPQDFRLIGEKLINKLKSGEFIPTREGDSISVSNAYVCTETLLAELLSYNNYEPLRRLTGKPKAKIVFTERKLFSDSELFVYFYKEFSSEKSELQANWLGAKYKDEFLEGMPEEFDILFFKYLTERANTILAKNQPLWKKPFIPVEDSFGNYKLVPPNNAKGEPQVFVGGAKVANRNIVANYLTQDPDIKKFLHNTLNFRSPNNFDDFYDSLAKYEQKEPALPFEEAKNDFFTALNFYKESSRIESEKLIKRLKEIPFILIDKTDSEELSYQNPTKLVTYYPKAELKDYFSGCNAGISCMAIDYYGLTDLKDELRSFLNELHVQFLPYYWEKDSKKNIKINRLHGLANVLEDISLQNSVYLADVCFSRNVEFKNELEVLRNVAWLYDEDGVRKKSNEIIAGKLHSKYPVYFNPFHNSLGALVEEKEDRYANLMPAEKSLLEALSASMENLTEEEVKEALAEFLRSKKKAKQEAGSNENEDSPSKSTSPKSLLESWTGEPVKNVNKRLEEEILSGIKIPKLPNTSDFWTDLNEKDEPENPGGYVSAPIIGNKYKQEQEARKKVQLEKEIELESKRNQLIELASQLEPYSFGWFKTLLELEDNFTAEDRVKRNPIRVVFGSAELDPDDLLVLSNTPNIPANIEDIGEISIQLFFDDEKVTVKGEVVSPKKKTLKIKLSNNLQIKDLDLSTVTRAVVEASSPDFILEKLKLAFAKLDFEDTDNLKSAAIIPEDLNFVFGPPGTGKTTYLSCLIGGKSPAPVLFNNVPVTPLMEQPDQNSKVLVLTPTNKAADVLVQRIIANYEGKDEYPNWLIRFGQTGSLEKEPVFVGDRKLHSWVYGKCTLVTTIARFPYDGFQIERREGEPDDWKIRDFNWDYVVFDEASMISQAAILYAIFYIRQLNPDVKFFIGGDPFQIPPIIQFEFPYWSFLPDPAFDNEGKPILDENGKQVAWKQDGGNIYAFTGLMKDDSFTNPKTEPHIFPIHNLTTQYRSLPPIGALFSHYRYGGILKHFRNSENIALNEKLEAKNLIIKGLPLKPLNIIRYPVKRHESIFRVRTVKGSPYQMYSAIFTVELIRYIQENINPESKLPYKIGIITPYALQNNIVSKLVEKTGRGPVHITTGTVHGFQGDECDLVVVLLNPPRNITKSPRSFLNKKNILNVAISRARDKMIVLVPFDPDNEINTNDLHQIRWLENLAGNLPSCKDNVLGYQASEIEMSLWGSETYIEDITFPTTHQNVNIYTEAAKKYEIRQDDNSIDVQLRANLFDDFKEIR